MQGAEHLWGIGPSSTDTNSVYVRQTYSVEQILGDRRSGSKSAVLNAVSGSDSFRKPMDNIGQKSINSYSTYASQHVYSARLPSCATSAKVFVSQRKDLFVVNFGEIFDLVNPNPLGPVNGETNTIDDKNVTAFTLPHSMTLGMATLQLVSLPSALVESGIALSVILSAVLMFNHRFHRRRWQIASLFGLIHGFGFAGVLTDLNLPSDCFFICLLAFNLGVEIGQLAIVSALLPIIYFARNHWIYRRVILPASACYIAVMGSVWFYERSADSILSFRFL